MDKKIIKARFKQRIDTFANWESANPVLLRGEVGWVSDNPGFYKLGDGATAWKDLPILGFSGKIVQELGNDPSALISQAATTAEILKAKQEAKGKQDAIEDLDEIRQGASKGATALQAVPSEYAKKTDLAGKVDKVFGKQLTTEDFTTTLKQKLESLNNYDDAQIQKAVSDLRKEFDTLLSGNPTKAIESFNEIIAFLNGVEDSENLDSIIASIEQQIASVSNTLASKVDKVAGKGLSTNDFDNSWLRKINAAENAPVWMAWEDLRDLRDNGELIEGRLYRIIDYETTTSQENTRSAGHRFDIIVLALDNHTLAEEAWAIYSEEDSYFADHGANLSAWKIWYSLDNNRERFAWADEDGGTGVIYRMIDEWGNDCPYDFKNIQFKRGLYADGRGIAKEEGDEDYEAFCYTFSWEEGYEIITDASIFGNNGYLLNDEAQILGVYGNTIKSYINYTGEFEAPRVAQQHLNNIVFLSTFGYEEGRFYGCYGNSFGNNCYGNSFGNNCYGNSFGNECTDNSFGNSCYNNSIGNYCYGNSFGNECADNSFGNGFSYNSFGNSCGGNSFGNGCSNNSFGNDCSSNSFGNDCCSSNNFGNDCHHNSFGNGCQDNSFGNGCYYNSFGNGCYFNNFGHDCHHNSFGNGCHDNSFGNECYDNSFGNGCADNTFVDMIDSMHGLSYNRFDNGVRDVQVYVDRMPDEYESVRYNHVCSGVSSNIEFYADETYGRTYAINSDGYVRELVLGDLA